MLKKISSCLFLSFVFICLLANVNASAERYIEDLVKEKHPLFHHLSGGGTNSKTAHGVIRNKEDLTVEFFYKATKTALGFEDAVLATARADTIHTASGSVFCWEGLDGKKCFYDIEKDEFLNLDHPERTWTSVKFSGTTPLFAQTVHEGWKEYWAQKDDQWRLLGKFRNMELQPVEAFSMIESCVYNYFCTHHEDDTGTLHLFKDGELCPTNLTRYLLTTPMGLQAVVDDKYPQTVIAILQYKAGYMDIDFLINPDANKARVSAMIKQAKGQNLLPDVSLSMSLLGLELDDEGLVRKMPFEIAWRKTYKGAIEWVSDGQVSVHWEPFYKDWIKGIREGEPPPADIKFHPPVHLAEVPYEGRKTFYLYSKNSNPSGKTIVMAPGGPGSFYDSGFRIMAHEWCTRKGHTLLFPQETLRTGYGYSHWKAGLGEIAQGNLRQVVAMIEHGLSTGLIPNREDIHLWGMSYGGFVSASLALRLPEFNPSFNFRSIIAEGPAMWGPEEDVSELFIQSEKDSWKSREDWSKEVSPLSYIGNPLSAPLLIITGDVDVRCPVDTTNRFASALSRHPSVAYINHAAGHEIFVGNEDSLEVHLPLLEAWMNGVPSNITKAQLMEKHIEIVFGEKLLLSSV